MSREPGNVEKVLPYESPRRSRWPVPISTIAAWMLRLLLLGFSGLAFSAALEASQKEPYQTVHGGDRPSIVPNQVAAMSAFGFAVAGGLGLIAAAIVRTDPRGGNET